MNDLLRPSSRFAGRAAPASVPAGVLGTIPNPSPEALRLATGTILRDLVVGEDGKGHVLVRTDLGVLAVATKAHVQARSEVTLQIRASGAQLHVLLMHSDAPAGRSGHSHPQGFDAAPRPLAPSLPDAQGGAAGAADVLTLGQAVRAVLQAPAHARAGPAPGAAPPPAPIPRLAPGSELRLRILAVQAPPATGTVAEAGANPPPAPPPAAPASTERPDAPTTSAAARGTPGGSQGLVPGPVRAAPGPGAGASASAAPVPSSPTAAPAGAGTSPTPGPQAALAVPGGATTIQLGPPVATGGGLRFGAEVTALTSAGRPVVQTPLGTLTLENRAPMPLGTCLQVEMPWSGLSAAAPAPPGAAAFLGGLGGLWSAIEEAVRVIRQAAPAPGAESPPAPALPQPGARLASGMLFFLAALSAGDVGRWLGTHAVETLRSAGREGLLARLSRDFGQLGRMAEGAGGEWRVFLIPLFDGQQVQPLRFYLRQGRRGRPEIAEVEAADATRFVLEVELSRLGDIQLDGLVRPDRFDLMLRTRQALPEPMRRDIAQIFADANGAAGYDGTIGFQVSGDWPVMPPPVAGPAPPSNLVV